MPARATPARVDVSDEAEADLKRLAAEDPELVREALRQLLALEQQPYSGEKLRYKSNRKPLAEADCRKVTFDLPGKEPLDYRILYRLEPQEGSPDRVYVIAACPKSEAYGEGAARAAKRLRELAGKRSASLRQRL